MAHDKVSNHDLVVVTNATKHKFVADKKDDELLDPATNAKEKGENYVYAKGKLKGATLVTKIHGEKICVLRTAVGLPSEPERAPFVLGVKSLMPYRMFAKADEGSPDVVAEGDPIIRSTDPTKQNGDGSAVFNTDGVVDGSEVGDKAATELAFLKQKCAITLFEGKTSGKSPIELGEEKPGAGGAKNYIELLTGQEMEFEVERMDLTRDPPSKAETCQLVPKHTQWTAVRTGGDTETDTLTGNGTKFKIPKSFTLLNDCQEDSNQVGYMHQTGSELDPKAWSTSTTSEVGATFGAGSATVKTPVVNVELDWQGFIKLWKFQWGDTNAFINVDAQACTNPHKASIRLFPSRPATFKVEFPTVDAHVQNAEAAKQNTVFTRLRENLMATKEIVDFIAKLVGVDFKFDFKLLEGFYASVDASFKRCERVAKYGNKTVSPAHVGLYWKFEIGCTNIVYISFEIPIPLASFVVKAVPVVGPGLSVGIKKLEKWLEIEIGIKFTVGFGFGLNANLERDQHGRWVESGGGVTLSGELSAALYAKVVGLTGEVGIRNNITGRISIKQPLNYKNMVRFHIEGEIKPTFYAGLAYKGKFSRVGTAALVVADVAGSAASAVVGWWRGDSKEEAVIEDDFLSVSGADSKGERTVQLQGDWPIEPLKLGPVEGEL